MNGTLGGTPGECIAPACTPGEFAECRDDVEVRCNATGDDYDVTGCELGCEPGLGCRTCAPNEATCVNGEFTRCDATGAVSETETCPLGCFEDEPRCREIDPSNDLATYLDMVEDPPDLDLQNGGTIDTAAGTITTAGGIVIDVPTFLAPPIDGPGTLPIRVVVAQDVRLGDVNVVAAQPDAPPLAILARGTIDVTGTVVVRAGDMTTPGCVGGSARHETTGPKSVRSSGSGGGGHASEGGRGGDLTSETNGLVGGNGGSSSGTIFVVPLRGGCASGGVISNTNPPVAIGARGGGALQLTSRHRVRVAGIIDVNGERGFGVSNAFVGGGAGGGVLIEAPEVVLEDGAINAHGGDGATCNILLGCGVAGMGARFGVEATDGGSTGFINPQAHAGSGGGGLGRIRINTADGTYSKGSAFQENGLLTAGRLRTR